MEKLHKRMAARLRGAGGPEQRPLWQHGLALLLILLLCCAFFGWAAYTFLPEAMDRSRREIVNDDYAVLTEPLAADGELRQTMRVEGRLYGVVLDVATYNRVAHGTLHMAVLDADGTELARCDTDMTELLDNTFHRFVFDRYVEAGEGGLYTLVLTLSPETEADVLGFHRSDGPAQDFVEQTRGESGVLLPYVLEYDEETGKPPEPRAHYTLDEFVLTQDGRPVDGTLALQYVVQYAGGFIVRVFAFFSALLTVFFVLLYWLAFVMRVPLHRLVLLTSLVLGGVFLFLIPLRTAPDEYVHIASAYRLVNMLLGVPAQAQHMLWMRPGDVMFLENYDFTATSVFAWREVYEQLFAGAPAGDLVPVTARAQALYPPAYAASGLGVLLARLLGLGRAGLLVLGRLGNLVLYSVVVSRAVKRMPVAKGMLACVALLPMCLQMAASFSYDCFVLALCFYYIACCLDYALARERVGPWQIVLLCALAVLLAPTKVVYVAVLPLVFIIPWAKLGGKRNYWLAGAAVVAAGFVVCLLFNMGAVQASMQSGSVPRAEAVVQEVAADDTAGLVDATGADETAPAQEFELVYVPRFSVQYLLQNFPRGPMQALRVIVRTAWEEGAQWLQGIIGGRLGEPIAIKIEVSWLFVLGFCGVLFCSLLPDGQDSLVLAKRRRLGMGGIALVVFALLLVVSLAWTAVDELTLFGMQGRYLLPVVPLVLLALRGGNLRFAKPVARVLLYASAVLLVLTQVDAFTSIVAF